MKKKRRGVHRQCFIGDRGQKELSSKIPKILPSKELVPVVNKYKDGLSSGPEILESSINRQMGDENLDQDNELRNSINKLYFGDICRGDAKMAYKAMHMGRKNKDAIVNRARFNRYTIEPLFAEELNNNENRDWYDCDQLENRM